MKKTALILYALLLNVYLGISQITADSTIYLGQTPPDDIPIVFASGVVSLNGRTENKITFSPDGKMCFFSVLGGSTFYVECKNGVWTSPVAENSKFGGEPSFSRDGKRVYLNSKNARNKVGTCDISYIEKQDSSWSDPVSLGSPLNSANGQWHPCMVSDSSIYFSSNDGPICRSQYRNGVYEKPIFLPFPINGVSGNTWGDPYVSPDEKYIIFRSGRAGGFGSIDIYISYKKKDGSWTNPKNTGNKINTSGEEFSGEVSHDGKYYLYGCKGDIYWVSALFTDSLKHTNFIPYVKTKISNQTDTVGQQFNLTLSDTTFVDDDGNNTLQFNAVLSEGAPLPSWLSFDSTICGFSGTPDAAGILNIKVTATDSARATASAIFKLEIKSNSNSIPRTDDQSIHFYFNPSNGILNIKTEKSKKVMMLEISSMEGKTILKKFFFGNTMLHLKGNPKGVYVARLYADNKRITEKFCLE
jgi:hypothetical protein